MADIRATTTLDNRQFSQGLKDALREARTFRSKLGRTMNFNPLERVQRSLDKLQSGLGKARTVKFNVDTNNADQAIRRTGQAARRTKQELTDTQRAVEEYRNKTLGLRNAVEAGSISIEEGIRFARQFRDESLAAAQGAEQWSKEWRDLNTASGRASRTLKTLQGRMTTLGLSGNVAIGTTNRLANSFQQLQGAVTGALAAFGLGRAVRSLSQFSGEAASARNQYAVFTATVEQSGQSIGAAEAAIGKLADRLKLTREDLAQSATQLFRFGASIEEVEELAEIGAASALAAGRTTAQGIEAITQAVVTGNSQRLEAIGIISNLGTVYQNYARELGKTSDQLTDQQRIEAALQALREETSEEVAALIQLLSGYAGTQSEATKAFTNFRRALGEGAQTILGPALSAITGLINAFNRLPGVLRNALATTSLVTAGVTGLALAYGTLRVAIVNTGVAQTALSGILSNQLILRSRLGAGLLSLANRHQLLERRQIATLNASRKTTVALTGMRAAAVGLGGLVLRTAAALRTLTVASLAFIATPLGATLAAVGASVATVTTAVNRFGEVLEPAMTGIRESMRFLRQSIQTATGGFRQFLGEGGQLAEFLRNPLISIVEALALTIAKVGQVLENVAALMQFFRNIVRVGLRQAIETANAQTEAARDRFERLKDEITGVADAARDNANALEENAEATEEAGDAAERAADQVQGLREQFEDRLRDIEISLIEDDEARKIAEVRREFEKLREEIRAAAEETPEFQPYAGGFLSRTYQAEQERLTQLQEQGNRERLQEEQRQAQELAEAARERERAIVDARMEGRANEFELLEVQHEREIQDKIRHYDDLIQMARAHGGDVTEWEERRTRELTAIQERYAREVRALWGSLQDDLEDWQAELTRNALEGNDRALLSFDYAEDLDDLEERLKTSRERARGNAEELQLIDKLETQARKQLREQFWDDMLHLTRERGEELADLEAELRLRAARLEGDPEDVARAEHEARLTAIEREYADREEAAQGNAFELRKIQRAKAEDIRLSEVELQQALTDITEEKAKERREEAEAEAKAAEQAAERRAEAQANLNERLAEADEDLARRRAELTGDPFEIARVDYEFDVQAIEEEYDKLLETEGNTAAKINEIHESRNEALAVRNSEYEQELADLRATAAEEIDQMVQDSQDAVARVFDEDFRSDLSEVETLLADAAGRAGELRQQQESLLAAIPSATPDQARRLREEADAIDDAIRILTESSTEAAREIVTEAIETYRQGLEDAREAAGETAAELVERDVRSVIDQITAVQTVALEEAKTSVLRQIARLSAAGVEAAALAPLRDQVSEIDALLARQDRALADFADDAFTHLRRVANAVLEEGRARQVGLQAYRELIDLRRDALAEAEREEAGLEDVQAATRNLTSAQVDYLGSLRQEVSRLREVQGAYDGVFNATRDLAGLLGRGIPPDVIDAQRNLAEAAIDNALALQEQGAAFSDVRVAIETATSEWKAYEDTARESVTGAFEEAVNRLRGFSSGNDVRREADRLAELLETTFGVSADRFGANVRAALREAQHVDAGEFDFLTTLEEQLRFVFGQDYDLTVAQPEGLTELFDNLNEAAADSPDTIDQIDQRITELEQTAEQVRQDIVDALNFDAAAEGVVTAYESVLEQLTGSTGETFDQAGEAAVEAFTSRFETERDRLREELEDQIGGAAEQAGLTAGEGLVTAFASGIRQNQQTLIDEVLELVGSIRDFLPGSDAKRGPLRYISHAGKMLPRTLAEGALSQRGWLDKSMTRLLSGLGPPASFRAATAPASGAGGAGAPVMVNVDGRPQAAPGGLAVNARHLVSSVERELAMRGLKKGS